MRAPTGAVLLLLTLPALAGAAQAIPLPATPADGAAAGALALAQAAPGAVPAAPAVGPPPVGPPPVGVPAVAPPSVAPPGGPGLPAVPALPAAPPTPSAPALPDVAPPSAQPPAPPSCGGIAPAVTACSLGLTAFTGQRLVVTINAGTGFTGTVVATLTDSAGDKQGMSCVFTAYLGGVTPAPQCSTFGDAALATGPVALAGTVTNVQLPASPPTGPAAPSAPALGYWEIDASVA